jgi:uncharacterized repeat protein (TIGR03803 family)
VSTQCRRCNRTRGVLVSAAAKLALTLIVLASVTTASAQTFRLLYQFKSGRDGSIPYASLILDPQGNLYGTTMIDGAYSYGTVFRLSPDGKETVLHSFTGTGGDGTNPVAPLTRDAAGNLYGTTEYGGLFGGACGPNGCGIVFKVDPAGKETVLYRFTGTEGDGTNPWQGVVRDAAGNLYGTTAEGGDYGGGTVFKINSTGHETILHSFNDDSYYDDGSFPAYGSLVRDAQGNLYGTTYAGGQWYLGIVYKIDSSGTESILYNFSGSDGMLPYGTLVRDTAGNLYGTTYLGGAFGDGIVFKLDTNNAETIVHSFGASGDGVPPSAGLIADRSGNLYGATEYGGSSSFGTVFKLDASWEETILHNFSGKDGSAPALGLVRDSKGNLYGTTQYGGAYGGGVVFRVTP